MAGLGKRCRPHLDAKGPKSDLSIENGPGGVVWIGSDPDPKGPGALLLGKPLGQGGDLGGGIEALQKL